MGLRLFLECDTSDDVNGRITSGDSPLNPGFLYALSLSTKKDFGRVVNIEIRVCVLL